MNLLTAHIDRWKSFDCHTVKTITMSRIVEALTGLHAPFLEEFVLNDNEMDEVPVTGFIYPQTIHAPFARAGSTPKLRELALWSVPLRWNETSFSGLTTLELAYITDGQYEPAMRASITGLSTLFYHQIRSLVWKLFVTCWSLHRTLNRSYYPLGDPTRKNWGLRSRIGRHLHLSRCTI